MFCCHPRFWQCRRHLFSFRYELAQQLQQHQQAASIDDTTVDQQSIHVSTQMQVEIESEELQQTEAVTTDQEAILDLDQQQVVDSEETGLRSQLSDQPLGQEEGKCSKHTKCTIKKAGFKNSSAPNLEFYRSS